MTLYVIRNDEGTITSFMGLSDDMIEMLFIHPLYQGKGLGRVLVEYAVLCKAIYKVDVNEQNEQALEFYRHIGFNITGRDSTDPSGKPFPILHMSFTGK